LREARALRVEAGSKESLEKALGKYRQALAIFEKINAEGGAALTLAQMAVVHHKLGHYGQALACYEKVRAIRARHGDRRGEGRSLQAIGRVHGSLGRYRKALQSFKSALEISGEAGDEVAEGSALSSLATILLKLGKHRKALELSRKALEINRRLGNAKGEARALYNIGRIYRSRGRYQEALEFYGKALEINRKLGNAKGEGICLRNIAATYGVTGQYDKALEIYAESLRIGRKVGDPRLEGSICNSMGHLYNQMGKYKEALANFKKALDIFTRAGVPTHRSMRLIANLYLDVGKLDEAARFARESGSNACLGRYYLLRSEYGNAETHYRKLLEWAERTENASGLFTAYTGLGKVCEAQEDYKKAEEYYAKGMKLTEEIRSALLPSERVNFFDVKINGFYRLAPAKGLTRVRMQQNRAADSIESSEITRARAFADNISRMSDAGYSGVPAQVLEKEDELVTQLASLKKERSERSRDDDPERYDNLSKEIREVKEELDSLVRKLWEKYRPYASVKYPRPIALKDAAIRPGEHMVMFDVLGDGVGVKLIKGKKIVRTFFVRWNLKELERDIKRFRRTFEQVRFREFDPGLGHRLFRRLLAAMLTEVPEGTPIVIIPDGMLAVLPFEALVYSGKATWKKGPYGDYPSGLTYLGDVYPVSYYQSMTALTLARTTREKGKRGDRLLVIADPVFHAEDPRVKSTGGAKEPRKKKEYHYTLMDSVELTKDGAMKFRRLPETATLAQNLRRLYRGKAEVLTGLKANKTDFMTKIAPKLDRYGWIVLATHGLFSNKIPGVTEPFLVLTMALPKTDGFLRMTEVMALDMNADVVALPACQTGLGRDLAGEGVMSMGRAFQYAGARAVLMSLWSVAEDSSVQLVESFFSGLKQGKTNLEALGLARKEIRKAGYEHPFFWAAFILVGEPN